MARIELTPRGVGNVLRMLREHERLSQADVADLLEVNVQTYRMWERGVNMPPLKRADQLCDLFGVRLDSLVTWGRTASTDSGLGL